MCDESRKFITRTCSHFFSKDCELKAHVKEIRAKYKRKYPKKTIDGIKFGKIVNVDFMIRKR